MLAQANPSINMQKVAMKFLLQTDNAAAKYGVDQSNYLGGYLQRGGDPGQFEGYYARRFPQTAAISAVKMDQPNAPQAPAGLQLPPGFKYIGPAP